MWKMKKNYKNMWDIIKSSLIHVIGIPGQEKENGVGITFEEVVIKNFLKG